MAGTRYTKHFFKVRMPDFSHNPSVDPHNRFSVGNVEDLKSPVAGRTVSDSNTPSEGAPPLPSPEESGSGQPFGFLHQGLSIQGYRLEEEIGSGGMGTVWKATQSSTNRVVAIKMILVGFSAKSTDHMRFMAESVAMASVKHANVLEVLEFGNANGRPFLAMEYLPGGSLADKIREQNRLDQKTVSQLVIKICNGVQAAHDLGIVHRDLKPENILFDNEGEPKVIDFGLAKQLEVSVNTVSHVVLGTPCYMAPEQAEGKSRFVGPEADVYALGVILYECLTGTLPFKGDNHLQILRMVSESTPQSPRTHVPSLHRDIERVCLKCLAKDPSERYRSCLELAEDLTRFSQGRSVLAQRSNPWGRVWFWAKRNRLLAATAASALLLLLISSVGFAVLSIWALTERNHARQKESQATHSEALALSQQNMAESQVYIGNVQRALSEWKYGRPQTARDRLEACPFEKRDWEHDFVNTTVRANQVVLEGHTAEVQSIAYSPDGKWIASGSDDQTIKIWDAAQGTLVKTLKGNSGFVRSISFSGDGSTLAGASTDGMINIYDVKSWSLKKQVEGPSDFVAPNFFRKSISLDPTGKIIASGMMQSGLIVFWNTETAKQLKTFEYKTDHINHIAFSPDGKRLVAGLDKNTVVVLNTETNTILFDLIIGGRDATKCVCFSKDGKNFAAGGDDAKVRLWDATNGKLIHVFHGHTDTITSVAISPDGKWLASGSDDHTIRIWNTENGELARVLKGHGDVLRGVVFSPDGGKLASASWDKTVRIWDYLTDQNNRTLDVGAKKSRDVSLSRDGRLIATAMDDGFVKIWSGKKNYILTKTNNPKSSNHICGIDFNPNGNRIVAGGADSFVYLWDTNTRDLIHTFAGHKATVQSCCHTPDGKQILSGSDDKTVKIWDAETGKQLKSLDIHTAPVLGVNVSADGNWFASASNDKTVKIWNARNYTLLWDLNQHTHTVRCVAFSPDSKRVVTGDTNKTIRIWDMENGKLLRTLKGHIDGITHVSYSPDGRRILSSSFDNSLKLWDAMTGAEILTLAHHTASVRSAKYSHDGKIIASVGDDGKLVLWDGSHHGEQQAFKGHDGNITQAGFSPDEKYLISRDERGVVKIWDRTNGNEILEEDMFHLKDMGTLPEVRSRDGCWKVEARGQDLLLVDVGAREARMAQDKNRLTKWGKGSGE